MKLNPSTRPVETAIPLPMADIAAFCRRWGVREFALFGSVLRPEQFGPQSDVDVLVTLEGGRRRSLLDFAAMERDLERLFGREVDLLERQAVEHDRNRYRREPILQSAEVIHAR